MNNKLNLFFLLIVVFKSMGQNERALLKGQIVEFQKPIKGAHIHNLSNNQGTSTLRDGTFLIPVQLKDTLSITHVKYQPLRVIITKEHLNRNVIVINVYEMTNQLDTIFIKNHSLIGNLYTDSKSAPRVLNKDSIIIDLLHLARKSLTKSPDINKSIPPIVVVDPILRTLGVIGARVNLPGIEIKRKDIKIKRGAKAKRNFPKEIIASFGVSYFTETLKIPEDRVHLFITYCEYRNIMELYKENEFLKTLTILEEESIKFLKTID